MDKQFYQGTVKSYDPLKRKHVVLYDDGDVEVLGLENERWELVDNGHKSSKKLNSSNGLASKEVSPGKKNKNSGGSRWNKESTKIVKKERTPKSNLKTGRKGLSKIDLGETEDMGNSGAPSPEPSSPSKADELNSGDSDGEQDERRDENISDKEDSEKEVKSVSKRKQLEHIEESLHDSDESDGEKTPDFEARRAKDIDSVPQDSPIGDEEKSHSEDKEADESSSATKEEDDEEEKSDSEGSQAKGSISRRKEKKRRRKSSKPSDHRHSEASDDEPLWKNRAGKRGSKR